MYYPPSYRLHFLHQTSIFVYNFYSGVNFCRKKICGSFILWELIFADRKKTRKNRKNYNPQKFNATRYTISIYRGYYTAARRYEFFYILFFYIVFTV